MISDPFRILFEFHLATTSVTMTRNGCHEILVLHAFKNANAEGIINVINGCRRVPPRGERRSARLGKLFLTRGDDDF